MNNHEDQEQELIFKQLTRHFLQDQLEQLKGNKPDKNKSFVYLESTTLNILLVYLLMNMNVKNRNESVNSSTIDSVPEEILEELNTVINQNKDKFEEIINQLKDGT
ncbi:hypothetical protein ACFFHM_05685 [Halalkalibacter kiskunsagensis]|uniref:Uncharacterized protein n=1 Tax=Halalkalibacter kiskunsagensis TaxID=1548599 RepID=A0ABV6K9P2_9BACI